MKIKRQKFIRKYCKFYWLNYKIRPPYKIILDFLFLQSCVEGKILLREQMPKLMQADVDLCTTRCIIEDLRKRGKVFSGAHKIAKSLTYLKCRHKKKYISADQCIYKLLNNDNNDRLICAVSDKEIRKSIQQIPGVPILSVHGNYIYMEAPNKADKIGQEQITINKSALNQNEKDLIDYLNADQNKNKQIIYKRKRIKGPNPLSMKKKKKKPKLNHSESLVKQQEQKNINQNNGNDKKKRKRKRKKKILKKINKFQ